MGPVKSYSTSVLHESYHADNEENGKALTGSGTEGAFQDAARPSNSHLLACFRWWLPELFASLLSVGSFLSLAATARIYHGRDFHDTNLLPSLSLNSLIALLSTFNRVALMVPVGSAKSQEVCFGSTTRKEDRPVVLSYVILKNRTQPRVVLGGVFCSFSGQGQGTPCIRLEKTVEADSDKIDIWHNSVL